MDYRLHYDLLIERARYRVPSGGYVERHHVLPRCLDGGDEPENIVRLTPEEHYVAHQLLVKMYPEKGKLVFAALAMTRGRPGNKRYGWLRRRFSKEIGIVTKNRVQVPFSAEHRAKISAGQLGRKRGAHSADHKAKLSQAHKGKILTPEHREKLAKAKLGIKREPYKELTCPHCQKQGSGGTMRRWHFDNCRAVSK